jgi:hypothetical protein
LFCPVSLAVKPRLTPTPCENRLKFGHERVSVENPNIFDPQYQTIHVDKKWFQQQQTKLRCYATIDEELKSFTTQHKSHIQKVMFLCAIPRPLWYRLRRGADFDVVFGGGVMASQTRSGYAAVNQETRTLQDSDHRSNNKTWWFDGEIGTYSLVEEKIQQRRYVYHKWR